MSKKIIGIGLALVAIAIPFVGPVIGAAIGLSALGTAALIAGLEVGIALTQSVLLGPSVPKIPQTNPVDRLYANLDTTTPRKIVFGDTAGATDIRYHVYTGADQEFFHQVIAVAAHALGSIYEIWIDNERAWTSAGGVQGRFVGYLVVNYNLNSNGGDAIDATWTSNCKLSACAWVHLTYTLLGPDDETPSPFQGGISGRLTIRCAGPYIYDPRLDSAVPGGSGSHQSGLAGTWAYSSTGSRNPALQLLWYMLGWPIFGKLSVGMGIPPERIDLPSFITAANICDESVTLSIGGTEPRYRSDGVLSEGDDRQAVIDTLCSTMNATLRDAGGKIAIEVIRDDLGSPVADFGLDDILGEEEWVQTPPLHQYFNVVRGRFVDPSNDALYQLNEYPSVSITSPDGIERIQTVDYPLVQSASQAQRLAKLRLMRNQHQGRYSAVFGSRAWQVSVGNIVRMTHAGLTFSNKLFRVAEQKIGRNGQTRMTLVEEDSAGYSWIAEERPPRVPRTPPIADPGLNPIFGFNRRPGRSVGAAVAHASADGRS